AQYCLPGGDTFDQERVDSFLRSYLLAVRAYNRQRVCESDEFGVTRRLLDLERSEQATEEFLFARLVHNDKRQYYRRLRAALIFLESYCDKFPELTWPKFLVAKVLRFDHLVVLWRTSHALLAERLIGRRPGTAGS